MRGLKVFHPFYEAKPGFCNGSRRRTFLISRTISSQLLNRYGTVKPKKMVQNTETVAFQMPYRKEMQTNCCCLDSTVTRFALKFEISLPETFIRTYLIVRGLPHPLSTGCGIIHVLSQQSILLNVSTKAVYYSPTVLLILRKKYLALSGHRKNETHIEGGAASPAFEFNNKNNNVEKFEEVTK